MLIIDDNKMKLLKMRRKLLEVSNGNNNRILNDYKDIILDIDNKAYNDLVEEVNNVSYSNLSLEEQIDYFNQIDADYTYLNELQCSFKRIFSKYSGFDIELSDISVIAIDEIRERVSAIQAYLLNCKNLENNKIELEKLNDDFILENKKNNTIIKQINSLEEKTKNDLLLAEGRIQNNNGGMEYTSIQEEFKNFDIDLKKILANDSLLHDIYNEAKEEYRDNEEMLEAALICYQNDNNNNDVYNRIKLNTLKSKYKLILLSIVLEVCTKNDDYSLVKTKVNKILDLIKQRKKTLQELNIKHFIDPFDRININNYMEVIKLFDDNIDNMTNLRHTISYFTSLIEEITFENEVLLNKINTSIRVIYNNSNNNQVDKKEEELVDNSLNSLLLVADEDDKVIKIRDIGNDFLLDRVYEKAKGVINRVNQMFTNIPADDKVEHFQTIPELVIEDVSEDKDDIINNEIVFNNDNIFKDNKEIGNENNNVFDSTTDKNDLFEELLPFTNNIEKDEIKVNDKIEYDNDDVFEEVVPFESAPLFDNKYDDDIFNDKDNKEKQKKLIDVIKEEDNLENTMPDIFWNDSNEKVITDNENDDNVLSFDEQVEALIGNTKTKKRAA